MAFCLCFWELHRLRRGLELLLPFPSLLSSVVEVDSVSWWRLLQPKGSMTNVVDGLLRRRCRCCSCWRVCLC